MLKYLVSYTNPRTNTTSPIDIIEEKEGFTAEEYIKGCEENAEDSWVEMIKAGTVTVEEIEETEDRIKELKDYYGFTYETMSYYFGIPKRTLENWVHRHTYPEYIFTMIEEILQLNMLLMKNKDENFNHKELGEILYQAKKFTENE